MVADLGQRLFFQTEVVSRPDLELWLASLHLVYIIELTVPWEDAVEEAYERKKLRYTELNTMAGKQRFDQLR